MSGPAPCFVAHSTHRPAARAVSATDSTLNSDVARTQPVFTSNPRAAAHSYPTSTGFPPTLCSASCCSRVYGNSYENVLVAVVVPDKKALTAWASDNGLGDASFEELCDNSKVIVRKLIMAHC